MIVLSFMTQMNSLVAFSTARFNAFDLEHHSQETISTFMSLNGFTSWTNASDFLCVAIRNWIFPCCNNSSEFLIDCIALKTFHSPPSIKMIVVFFIFIRQLVINRHVDLYSCTFLCNIPRHNSTRLQWLRFQIIWFEPLCSPSRLWWSVQPACRFNRRHVDLNVLSYLEPWCCFCRRFTPLTLAICDVCWIVSFFYSNLKSNRHFSFNIVFRFSWSCLIVSSTSFFNALFINVFDHRWNISTSVIRSIFKPWSIALWNIKSSPYRKRNLSSIFQILFRFDFLIARACHEMLLSLYLKPSSCGVLKTGLTTLFSKCSLIILSKFFENSTSSLITNTSSFVASSNAWFRNPVIFFQFLWM